MNAPAPRPEPGSNAGIILEAWDRVERPSLPIDWLMWRVPVRGPVEVSPIRPAKIAELGKQPRLVETVLFRRVTCRAFDHGAMWSIVFGQFDGTEIMVEAVRL